MTVSYLLDYLLIYYINDNLLVLSFIKKHSMDYKDVEEIRIKLKHEKSTYKKTILLTTIITIVLFVIITYIGIARNYIVLTVFSAIVLIISIILITKLISKIIKLKVIYLTIVKEHIIDKELKNHYSNIVYVRDNSISLKSILKSEIIEEPDEFFGVDYLTGSYKGVSFEVSEVVFTEVERLSDDEGQHEEERDEFFNGLWFKFKLNKFMPGKVKILQENLGANLIGHIRVETEMIVFNKLFSSFTTNKLLYFNIFNPTRIENLIKINHLYPYFKVCSFIKDELHIGFNSGISFLHVNLDTVINENTLDDILKEFLLPKQIIDLLDLSNIASFR